jgi:HK97 family phage major capsid protein
MAFPALDEAKGKLDLKRKELGTIFDEAGPDLDFTKVKAVKGTTHEIAAHVRKLNDEQTDLAKEYENLCAVQKAAERTRQAPNDGGREHGSDDNRDQGGGGRKEQKSLGQLFVESDALKGRKGPVGPTATLDVELKTTLTTTAGWAPEVLRTGTMVPFATRPIQIADIIPTTTTTQAAVQYMEETTFTNAAAEIDELGTYQEAALAFTERLSSVRKIGVYLPVSDEQLEDVPQARGMIDNRLPFMIRQKLDAQIISGSGVGTPTQLRGVMNVVGIQTQAKGADPTPDAVYKAIVKVEVTGQAFANVVVMHPNNWQDVRLLRTADGLYIWGNPSDTGPERIWGLQVVRAQAATAGTAIVGDWANFAELAIRHGIDMQVSNSHASFFINGTQAIRADIRCALVFYRPAAFCTVTGL